MFKYNINLNRDAGNKLTDRTSICVMSTCADWEKQKSDNRRLLPGIWNVELFQVNNDGINEILNVPVNCFGSSLRKVIVFGPPYPSEMKLEHAAIE